MAEKLMTDGSMRFGKSNTGSSPSRQPKSPKTPNCGLRHTPVSAPPLMTSSTPSPPRTVTTVT